MTTCRIVKIITMLTNKNRSPNTAVLCILVFESPRKPQCSQAPGKTTLYLHREEREEDQL